jgi:hypothetical protein
LLRFAAGLGYRNFASDDFARLTAIAVLRELAPVARSPLVILDFVDVNERIELPNLSHLLIDSHARQFQQ